MGKITWTEEAKRWMREIYDFIANDNPEAAGEVVLDIFNNAQKLMKYPQLGRRLSGYDNLELRCYQYDNFRIVYLVKKIGAIEIIGVFHNALDINRYLKL